MDAEQQEQLTAAGLLNLKEGISLICLTWTALQLAVQQGAGGRHLSRKGQQLENEIFSWFTQPGGGPLHEFELKNELRAFLDCKLSAQFEDVSIEDVAAKLMAMYKEFLVDDFSSIEKPRQKSRSEVKSSVRIVVNDDDDDDNDDDDDDYGVENMEDGGCSQSNVSSL